MRITVVSPLFPPDTGMPAPYTKELLKRMANYEVRFLGYGQLPERVAGVEMKMVSKKQPVVFRMLKMLTLLLRELRHSDLVYAINGPSVELPVALASIFTRTPLVLDLADKQALIESQFGLKKLVYKLANLRAEVVIQNSTDSLERPEIVPFKEQDHIAVAKYQSAWTEHLKDIAHALKYVTK